MIKSKNGIIKLEGKENTIFADYVCILKTLEQFNEKLLRKVTFDYLKGEFDFETDK